MCEISFSAAPGFGLGLVGIWFRPRWRQSIATGVRALAPSVNHWAAARRPEVWLLILKRAGSQILGKFDVSATGVGQERDLHFRVGDRADGRLELDALRLEFLREGFEILYLKADVIERAPLGRSQRRLLGGEVQTGSRHLTDDLKVLAGQHRHLR